MFPEPEVFDGHAVNSLRRDSTVAGQNRLHRRHLIGTMKFTPTFEMSLDQVRSMDQVAFILLKEIYEQTPTGRPFRSITTVIHSEKWIMNWRILPFMRASVEFGCCAIKLLHRHLYRFDDMSRFEAKEEVRQYPCRTAGESRRSWIAPSLLTKSLCPLFI
jgi:hypothetical protein